MTSVIIIGITGLAGAGKSSIINYIKNNHKKNKIFIIDMDKIGHEILDMPVIQQKLINKFSDSIISNNKINRKILGDIVFKKKEQLKELNNIVHPEMKRYIKQLIDENLTNYDIILIDGALLFPLGIYKYCNYTIFIDTEQQKLLNRLINFRKIDKIKAENILKRQKYLLNFKKDADFIINNNGPLTHIHKQIDKIFVDFILKNS